MSIASVRLERLQELLKLNRYAGRGGQARLGADINKAPAQISQWLSGARTINEDSARNIEQRLRLPALWMDGSLGAAWPFTRISPARWATASDDTRMRAELMIELLLGAEELDPLPTGWPATYPAHATSTALVVHEPVATYDTGLSSPKNA
jgi:hypothetical protein